ncbi:hypothetical protein DESUT3_40790 [Desulfuromonas versatilis]|uniref:Type 4 fimbrial biogenesis protein PilX N-terminal domain-containing protein n=2 Tax=Desulfuromonas versatilis TaxID=2802975 RepID=A0ABN6E3S6_9BACT|nr:hypothetical protein DESUT3_40790 [Desulfuromonas versatilis]
MLTALLMMAMLTASGVAATRTTLTELQIAGNEKVNSTAFYQAEAGIEYGRWMVQNGLDKEALTAPDETLIDLESIDADDEETYVRLSFDPPDEYNFRVNLVISGDYPDNVFAFSSTGEGAHAASSTVSASFGRDVANVLTYAAFGNSGVDLKSNAAVYSYTSSCGDTPVSDPSPTDSTGAGDIGSNAEVSIKNNTFIDGDVVLGASDDGTTATLSSTGTPTVTGETGVTVDQVDPDPLGAAEGDLADTFTAVAADNDNAAAGITGTELSLASASSSASKNKYSDSSTASTTTSTLTLTAGDYYFTDITLNNGAELIIDTSAGAVNIYLSGGLEAKNGSEINIQGDPSDFTIFSDSTDALVFKHGSDFKGVIYAPYAKVEMKNSADFYGAIFADEVQLHSSGEIWYDECLAAVYQKVNSEITPLSWRQDQ